MDPNSVTASYARALKDRIAITRTVSGTATTATDIRARVLGYGPSDIAGAVMQGDERLILFKDDLDAQSWPVPPKYGDVVTVNGLTRVIQSVDKNTIKIGQTLIAYKCQMRGT